MFPSIFHGIRKPEWIWRVVCVSLLFGRQLLQKWCSMSKWSYAWRDMVHARKIGRHKTALSGTHWWCQGTGIWEVLDARPVIVVQSTVSTGLLGILLFYIWCIWYSLWLEKCRKKGRNLWLKEISIRFGEMWHRVPERWLTCTRPGKWKKETKGVHISYPQPRPGHKRKERKFRVISFI